MIIDWYHMCKSERLINISFFNCDFFMCLEDRDWKICWEEKGGVQVVLSGVNKHHLPVFTNIRHDSNPNFNSLPPGRCSSNYKRIILKLMMQSNSMSTPCEFTLRWWMSQNVTNGKSTLVQVMAWWSVWYKTKFGSQYFGYQLWWPFGIGHQNW